MGCQRPWEGASSFKSWWQSPLLAFGEGGGALAAGEVVLRGCILCLVLRLGVYPANCSMKWHVKCGGVHSLLPFSLRFPKEIHSGLLEVISPSPHFYPDFSHLRESFGDPKERVR